jgi:hypothetical protein
MTISVVSGLGLLTRDAIAVESVSTMMLKIGSRQVGPTKQGKEGRKEGNLPVIHCLVEAQKHEIQILKHASFF